MPRNPEYQQFLNLVSGKELDTLPTNLETTATPQEIGWWKQHQMARAIHHFRQGAITPEEKNYLMGHWMNKPVNR